MDIYFVDNARQDEIETFYEVYLMFLKYTLDQCKITVRQNLIVHFTGLSASQRLLQRLRKSTSSLIIF